MHVYCIHCNINDRCFHKVTSVQHSIFFVSFCHIGNKNKVKWLLLKLRLDRLLLRLCSSCSASCIMNTSSHRGKKIKVFIKAYTRARRRKCVAPDVTALHRGSALRPDAGRAAPGGAPVGDDLRSEQPEE